MKYSREQVLQQMLQLIGKLSDDWDYEGKVTAETALIADMGLGSLDIVVLAMAVQQEYGQVLPFTDLFAELGQRGLWDISVLQWADFVHEHLNDNVKGTK